MSKHRIKFVNINDLSVAYNLKLAKPILDKTIKLDYIKDINDAIELFNIKRYIDEGCFLDDWDKDLIDRYKHEVNKYDEILNRYLDRINNDNFFDFFEDLYFDYRYDFFTLLSKYNTYLRIKEQTIKKCFESERFSIEYLLFDKKLAEYYASSIVDYCNNNVDFVCIVIDYYLKDDKNDKKLYFPKALNKEILTSLIERYVNSENPNVNYLELIINSNSNDKFDITPRLRLDAENKIKEFFNTNKDNMVSSSIGFSIEFLDRFESYITKDDKVLHLVVDKTWIKEHLDYPTILNNFIFIFDFVDKYGISNLILDKNRSSAIEEVFASRGKKDYHTSTSFRFISDVHSIIIAKYLSFLSFNCVYFEDVIEWFFKDYLYNEFKLEGFIFNKSPKDDNYILKCKNICSEKESILKQYTIYCKEGRIDKDILKYINEQIRIENVPSLLNNKYYYPKNDLCKNMLFQLFSDQSNLSCFSRSEYNLGSFYRTINTCALKYDELHIYQKELLKPLLNNNILYIDNELYIKFDVKIELLYILYSEGVLPSLSILSNDRWDKDLYKKGIKDLVDLDLIYTDSKLFSIPEQHLYNYMLNESEYSNGPKLRNAYSHGNMVTNDKAKEDYCEFLKMLILIVCKINEELNLSLSLA